MALLLRDGFREGKGNEEAHDALGTEALANLLFVQALFGDALDERGHLLQRLLRQQQRGGNARVQLRQQLLQQRPVGFHQPNDRVIRHGGKAREFQAQLLQAAFI